MSEQKLSIDVIANELTLLHLKDAELGKLPPKILVEKYKDIYKQIRNELVSGVNANSFFN